MPNLTEIIIFIQNPSLNTEVKQNIIHSYFFDIIHDNDFSINTFFNSFLSNEKYILGATFFEKINQNYSEYSSHLTEELKLFLEYKISKISTIKNFPFMEQLILLSAKIIPYRLLDPYLQLINGEISIDFLPFFIEAFIFIFDTENIGLKKIIMSKLRSLFFQNKNINFIPKNIVLKTLISIVSSYHEKFNQYLEILDNNDTKNKSKFYKNYLCKEICDLTESNIIEVEKHLDVLVKISYLSDDQSFYIKPFDLILKHVIELFACDDGFLIIKDWTEANKVKCVSQTKPDLETFSNLNDTNNSIKKSFDKHSFILNELINDKYVSLLPIIETKSFSKNNNKKLDSISVLYLIKDNYLFSELDVLFFVIVFPFLKNLLVKAISVEKGKMLMDVSVALEYIQHNFKLPLTNINNYIEYICESFELTSDLNELIQKIKIEKDHLRFYVRLIQKFILIEKKMYSQTKTTFNIKDFMDELLGIFSPKINNKNIYINIPRDITIHADKDILLLAIGELLKNAITFSESSIKIKIVNDTNLLYFFITDDGPFIEEKNKYRIFWKFFSDKSGGSGTGLGLSFVKNVASLLNGEIVYDDSSNEKTFIFKLLI